MPFRFPHDTDWLTSGYHLSDGVVYTLQAGEKTMISLAMFDDQELPISAEAAGEDHPPAVGGDDLRAGPGLDDDSLAGQAGGGGLAVKFDQAADGGKG